MKHLSQNWHIFKFPGKRLAFLTWKYAHLANTHAYNLEKFKIPKDL